MFSLKPKQGGSPGGPLPPPANTNLLKGGIALALVLILGLAYNAYSTRTALQGRIDSLEQQLVAQTKEADKRATDMASDIEVVTKKVGVTTQELDASRRFAEKLKSEQEK